MSSKPPSARQIAVRTLRAIDRRNGFSNRVLSEELEKHPELARADRGYVTTLVYGVLRHRKRLDHHIDAVAKKPAGIKGELRALLRVAAFEIVVLDKPAPVVGSEATRVARSFDRDGRLKGLITAVIANIERRKDATEASLVEASPLDRLEVQWSIPRWLAGRWIQRLGAETAISRGAALAEVPSVDLRVDLGRITREEAIQRLVADHPGIEVDAPPEHPATLRARGGGDLFYGPLHDEGLVSVQGLGSQRAAQVLAPRPGERVWDACAGMGTKTVQLAELMQRRGRLYATDPSRDRLDELELARVRAHLDVEGLDLRIEQRALGGEIAATASTHEASFDAILIDAPCTGLGNLGRHPELRWTSQFGDIAECAALQARILTEARHALAPDGRLVYAVCSLEPEEGPDLLARLAPALDLEVISEESWTPESHGTDGFYLALCRTSSRRSTT